MDIYNQLVNEYEVEKEKMNNGDEVNKLELMFKGYALDAVDTGKRNFGIFLDFSEDSIKDVERILDILNKSLEIANPKSEIILNFAKKFSGYIGQIMKLKWDGEWKDESEYSIKNGPSLKVKDQDLFLLSKVYRRIVNGSDDNVWHFYQVIKKDIEGSDDMEEVKNNELTAKEKKNFLRKFFG